MINIPNQRGLTMNLYCGNCVEVMKTFSEQSFDAAITSPPYNVGRNGMTEGKYAEDDDIFTPKEYVSLIFGSIRELIRVSKIVFYNIQLTSGTKFVLPLMLYEFKDYFKETLIWVKKSAPPEIEPGVLNTQFEFVFVFAKYNADKRKFYGEEWRGNKSNIFTTAVNSGNEYADVHGAAFPKLMVCHLLNIVSSAKSVIDPFLGTGTTGVACAERDLNFTGIDINLGYVNLSKNRIKNALLQPGLFSQEALK